MVRLTGPVSDVRSLIRDPQHGSAPLGDTYVEGPRPYAESLPSPTASFATTGSVTDIDVIDIPIPRDSPYYAILGRDLMEELDISGISSVSRSHAAIAMDLDHPCICDWGSMNGTRIYRVRPEHAGPDTIRVSNEEWVRLEVGDIIGFGGVYFEWRIQADSIILARINLFDDSSLYFEQEEYSAPVPPEQPLIDRLREAADGQERVELFVESHKEKYVGFIEVIESPDETPYIRLRTEDFVQDFSPSEILTVRYRNVDHNDLYIHSRIRNSIRHPQFKDRSINISGTDGSGQVVLVDFEDPRLTHFLKIYMRPIRDALSAGHISEEDAACHAWRIVHDYVPYDKARGIWNIDIKNQMYRLGDFIERGVCNERGMLLQVSLQYIGVESRMEKGPFLGGRHAWVRAKPTGAVHPLILDPQMDEVYRVGVDLAANLFYRDDSTPFAQDKSQTITDSLGEPYSVEAERYLRAEDVDLSNKSVQDQLLAFHFEFLGDMANRLTAEQIERIRFRQIHHALSFLTYADALQQIFINRPYSHLSEVDRLNEQRVAVEIYRSLNAEERAMLWRHEGREPDGLLPEAYIERYRELRIALHEALHEERHYVFGVDGFSEHLLAELRAIIPLVRPDSRREKVRTLFFDEVDNFEDLERETRDEIYGAIIAESERRLVSGVGRDLDSALVREVIVVYRAAYPEVGIRLVGEEVREAPEAEEAADTIVEDKVGLSGDEEKESSVSVANIRLTLIDRYPLLEHPKLVPVLDAIATAIYQYWEQDGGPPEDSAWPGVPPKHIVKKVVTAAFQEMRDRGKERLAQKIEDSGGPREDLET